MSTVGNRLSWTALGVRMGFAGEQPQREEILSAIGRMAWTATATQVPSADGSAVRAILDTVLHQHHDHLPSQIRAVGVARLDSGRQLIGLQHSTSTRSYLLDLGSEAIYVLAEFARLHSARAHVARCALPQRPRHPRRRRTAGE